MIRIPKRIHKYIAKISPRFYLSVRRRRIGFNSQNYWRIRNRDLSASGSGSRGSLLDYKVEFINSLISRLAVTSLIDWGFGDGALASRIQVQDYLGIEISEDLVNRMLTSPATEINNHKYILSGQYTGNVRELALSIDVIYHLTEDSTYHSYMANLFSSSSKYVLIYSSGLYDTKDLPSAIHVRHRDLHRYHTANLQTEFSIEGIFKNPFPYNKRQPENTSFADFILLKRLPLSGER